MDNTEVIFDGIMDEENLDNEYNDETEAEHLVKANLSLGSFKLVAPGKTFVIGKSRNMYVIVQI